MSPASPLVRLLEEAGVKISVFVTLASLLGLSIGVATGVEVTGQAVVGTK